MASKTPMSRSMAVASAPSAIAEVCKWVLPQLLANSFSNSDIFAVRLALEEAFLNAIKHGNKMDSEKEIKIGCLVDMDKVEISMTDQGNGFDPTSVPDPRCKQNLYKAHGRGLLLIRSYMDIVEFNERGNSVRMVKYREK